MKIQSILLGLIAAFTLMLAGCASYQEMMAANNAANDPSLREKTILTSGDYCYYVATKYNSVPKFAGKAVIKDYVGSAKNIIIPSEIDGYPIVAIDGINNKKLKSVTLPKSLELIGESFENCQLSSITISEDGPPLTISQSLNKNKLTKLTIPARVKTLSQSFHENPITSITFGDSDLKIILPFKNNLLFYSYMFDYKPGTYEQRGNLVYFNGQPTVTPAFIMDTPGIVIENVDKDAKNVGRSWIMRPGSHTIVVQHEVINTVGDKLMKTVRRGQLTADFQAGKQYMVKAITNSSYIIQEI